MARKPRLRDRLQVKHCVELYDVSRATIQRWKAAGEWPADGKNGWTSAAAVRKLMQEKGISLRQAEPAQVIEASDVSGAGLVPPELLEQLRNLKLPPELVNNAEDLDRAARSIVGIYNARDKRSKAMAEAGRTADVKETSELFAAGVQRQVVAARKMPDELGASIARKRKLKTADVKAVLADAGAYMCEILAGCLADVDARVQAFEDEKSTEVKQRRRGK